MSEATQAPATIAPATAAITCESVVRIHRHGLGAQRKQAPLGQQRLGVVLGLRAGGVGRAAARTVDLLAHIRGQIVSSRTSISGARGSVASSSWTTSSP